MADCHCIIYHPQTDDERKLILKKIESMRKIGDMAGVQLALAQLNTKCLAKDVCE